jgi:hypothetical protein
MEKGMAQRQKGDKKELKGGEKEGTDHLVALFG